MLVTAGGLEARSFMGLGLRMEMGSCFMHNALVAGELHGLVALRGIIRRDLLCLTIPDCERVTTL